MPPLTDVVGRLEQTDPAVLVRTKSGELVEVARADVLAVRPLSEFPVRTSQIRNLEHAAGYAWPGLEQHWLDGWLLRFSGGTSHRANSAVPLEPGAALSALSGITAWYRERGGTPWLAVPDRLVRLPESTQTTLESMVMTRDLDANDATAGVTFAERPDAAWLRAYERAVDVSVLTSVVDGEVAFASRADVAVGRGAVTTSPDGTVWAGLAAVHVADSQRRRGHGRALCEALLAWAAGRGATRAYVQVLSDNTAARALYESMGFVIQHRVRYVDASTL